MLWGFFNLAAAYVLTCRLGRFDPRATGDAVAAGTGVLLVGVLLARAFGRFHGGNDPGGNP